MVGFRLSKTGLCKANATTHLLIRVAKLGNHPNGVLPLFMTGTKMHVAGVYTYDVSTLSIVAASPLIPSPW